MIFLSPKENLKNTNDNENDNKQNTNFSPA